MALIAQLSSQLYAFTKNAAISDKTVGDIKD